MANAGYIDATIFECELNVQVEYKAYYENGECASPGYEIEELSITAVGGRVCSAKVSDWLFKKMNRKQREHIDTLCSEDANGMANFW